MNKRSLALWLAIPALLAGCSGTAAASPTATVTQTVTATVTVTATPTPSPTPTRSGPMALGTTATLAGGGTVTVFEHRKSVEPQDPNQEAIDIQACVPSQVSGTATVYERSWSLRDGANHSYNPASTTWRPSVNPSFWPPEQQVKGGDCYRAWVIIEGSNATPMTTARYTDDKGTILDWALPQ
ncbi:hypothetical protein [Arthrobacter sp. 162MFSha1.1]|uniref:hypothetical protein n=1 Tax=Arthrobacter sp. 162MFSha1.1 TaxID=1151119 RepID=UPI00035F5972|nr:hypothetical protein [Arthrobacter sp. 162MFSha1.1]